jgi:hypothetical protein
MKLLPIFDRKAGTRQSKIVGVLSCPGFSGAGTCTSYDVNLFGENNYHQK